MKDACWKDHSLALSVKINGKDGGLIVNVHIMHTLHSECSVGVYK